MRYTWREIPVVVTPTSDINYHLRPGQKYAPAVQKILDELEPWPEDEDLTFTRRVTKSGKPLYLPPMADEVRPDMRRAWGVHKGHKARRPGLSPFINRFVSRESLGKITLELERGKAGIFLRRAYGGEYTPPLPWMVSARDAHGGLDACHRYWQDHAYVSRDFSLILSDTSTNDPPEWWQASKMYLNVQTAS